MLVTRTPLRIPLGGGGTDLPAYYEQHGGFLVSAAINKYVYILVNERFEDSIRVSYSKTEIANNISDIEHPIVREALRYVGINQGLEIVSVADLPSNTGLGSSSSFTVGLLNALHTFRRESISPAQLAEEAYTIEVEILKEPIGKQDQYIASFGGIRNMEISTDGLVRIEPAEVHNHCLAEMESNLMLFYTGIQRSASDILGEQSRAVKEDAGQTAIAMHEIKAIGYQVSEALRSGNLYEFGNHLHHHWEAKKRLVENVSSNQIDHWYNVARMNGALGGKIMGAGGGGFFMFYCDSSCKGQVRDALESEGLVELRFTIEPEGSKVLVNF